MLAVAVGTSVVVSGALYLLSPVVGLLSGAVCTITIAGKVVYEESHHDFEDITISYMIRQLIDANNLIVTSRGEISFIHDNHVTVLSSPPEDNNEDTNAQKMLWRGNRWTFFGVMIWIPVAAVVITKRTANEGES